MKAQEEGHILFALFSHQLRTIYLIYMIQTNFTLILMQAN
jgi:hypothetical protein